MIRQTITAIFSSIFLYFVSLHADDLVAGALNLSLTITSEGDLAAMWQEPSVRFTGLKLSVRSLGGDWSAPYQIPVNEESSQPFLTGNQGSNLVAVWTGFSTKPSKLSSIRTCLDTIGGSWETTELISSNSSLIFLFPHLAINSSNNQVVAWESLDSSLGQFILHLATKFAPSMSWSSPLQVSKGRLFSFPNVAIDNRNRTAAIWIESINQKNAVVAAVGSLGNWGEPEVLSTKGLSANNPLPKVILNDNTTGTIGLAAWSESDGKTLVIQTRFLTPTGWGPSHPLQTSGVFSTQPVIALNDANRAVAVWQSTQDNVNWFIQAAVYDQATGWSNPQTLSIASSKLAQVAMNANGEAVVSWEIVLPQEKSAIEVIILSQEGEWGSITRFSDININTTGRVAIDDAGHMGVVWLANNGSRSFVRASVNDGGGDWTPPVTISGGGQSE